MVILWWRIDGQVTGGTALTIERLVLLSLSCPDSRGNWLCKSFKDMVQSGWDGEFSGTIPLLGIQPNQEMHVKHVYHI